MLLWMLGEPARLSPAVREIVVVDPTRALWVSAASAWEHHDPFDRMIVAQCIGGIRRCDHR